MEQLPLHWLLLNVREETMDSLAQRPEQAASLSALEQIAEALDNDRGRTEIALRRSRMARRTGDWVGHWPGACS